MLGTTLTYTILYEIKVCIINIRLDYFPKIVGFWSHLKDGVICRFNSLAGIKRIPILFIIYFGEGSYNRKKMKYIMHHINSLNTIRKKSIFFISTLHFKVRLTSKLPTNQALNQMQYNNLYN